MDMEKDACKAKESALIAELKFLKTVLKKKHINIVKVKKNYCNFANLILPP